MRFCGGVKSIPLISRLFNQDYKSYLKAEHWTIKKKEKKNFQERCMTCQEWYSIRHNSNVLEGKKRLLQASKRTVSKTKIFKALSYWKVTFLRKPMSLEQIIRQIGVVFRLNLLVHKQWFGDNPNEIEIFVLLNNVTSQTLTCFFYKWNRFMEKVLEKTIPIYWPCKGYRERNLRVKSANSLAPPFTWMWVINILFLPFKVKIVEDLWC